MIKEFKNYKEFVKFIDSNTYRQIGFGSEGTCYLGKDGLAYKKIESFYNPRNIDSIITNEDYNLKHFAFPIDIFTDEKHKVIFGYNTVFLKEDIFFNNENLLEDIDVDKLVECYYRLLPDIEAISKDNIYLFELINNLLFNNKKFLLIDTLDYQKKDHNTYKENIEILHDALAMPFHVLTRDWAFNDSNSIEELADNVKKHVKKKNY